MTAGQPFYLASKGGSAGHGATAPRLTPRQLEVLALLCEGLPNKLICRRLNIAHGTVKAHISSILHELGVRSRLQAVVAARKHGLLDDFSAEAGANGHNGDRGLGRRNFEDRLPNRRFGHGHS